MPMVYNHSIIDCRILAIKSTLKPGTIILENDSAIILSTIDYNIALYKDRLKNLLKCCEYGNLLDEIYITAVSKHINEQDVETGWTPLMVATYNNNIDVVKCLISIGADINIKNKNGTNLLMYSKEAYKRCHDNSLYKIFLNMGLNPLEKDYFGNDLFYYIEIDGISIEDLMR